MLHVAIVAFRLVAAEPACLHGHDETAEQAARRRDALGVGLLRAARKPGGAEG